jgi:hypothetical protein
MSHAISITYKMGISKALGDYQTVEEIAVITNTDKASLYRLLRALASARLLIECENKSFYTTLLGKIILSPVGNALSIGGKFLIECLGRIRILNLLTEMRAYRKAWNSLDYSLRTGKSAFTNANGRDVYSFLQENEDSARIFDNAVNLLSQYEYRAILSAFDFSTTSKILDIGGGLGLLLCRILLDNKHSIGAIFESPATAKRALVSINALGLQSRCSVIEGNFFEHIPSGFDTYLLKHILHNWDDVHALTILKNCRDAMDNQARVLIIEMIIPDSVNSSYGKIMDLEMLVFSPSGLERRLQDYISILEKAALKVNRIITTNSRIRIIEAGLTGPTKS